MHLPDLLIWFTVLVAGTSDPPPDSPDSPVRSAVTSYRFRTPDGKGSVQFPNKPKESKRTLRIGNSSISLQLATYATAEGDIFLFGYADLPATPPDADSILQGALEGLIRDNPMIQLKKIVFGEEQLPGREVEWRKDDKYMLCRYILCKQRLYQIMVLGSRQFVTSEAAHAFLHSLIIE